MLYLSTILCVHACVISVFFVFFVFFSFQLSPSVLCYCWLGLLTCKNRLPYNLYCVGGDVKHCSINQSRIGTVSKQADARPDGNCDMQLSQTITDYILTQFHISVYIYLVAARSPAPDSHSTCESHSYSCLALSVQ